MGLMRLNQLKQYLRTTIPSDIEIRWCNIASSDLHLVVIQDSFLELNNIQKILNKDIPILKIQHDHTHANLDENCFSFPCDDLTALKKWIERTVLLKQVQSSVQQINQPNAVKYFHEMITLDRAIEAPKYLALGKQAYVLIDHKHQVWLTQPILLQDFDCSHLTLHHAALNDVIAIKHQSVSTHSLIQFIWNSAYKNGSDKVFPRDQAYRIHTWPQPIDEQDYRVVLKLAACFSRGATPQQIHLLTQIPLQTIYQFLQACEFTHSLTKIPESESSFNQKTQVSDTTTNRISHFFSKLRRKLGL